MGHPLVISAQNAMQIEKPMVSKLTIVSPQQFMQNAYRGLAL